MIRKISRRHFLRALTFAGAAGAFAAQPVSSLAGAISQTAPVLTETRILMGTLVAVSVSDPSRARMEDALYAAFEHMETLIPFFDRHAVDSVLSVLNRQGALQDVPPELSALLARTRAMSALTQGAFNPTVQPLVDFFCSQALPDGRLNISKAELNEVHALLSPDGRSGWTVGSNGVRLERRGMGLTLDGIAKGRVADLMSRKLKPKKGEKTGRFRRKSRAAYTDSPTDSSTDSPDMPYPLGILSRSPSFLVRSFSLFSPASFAPHSPLSPRSSLFAAFPLPDSPLSSRSLRPMYGRKARGDSGSAP